MRLELGIPVHCSDGPYGEVADLVVDPTKKRVTHVVVRPKEQDAAATRLVPVELVEETPAGRRELVLRCSVADVNELDTVQEVAFLRLGEFPTTDPKWDVGVSDVQGLAVSVVLGSNLVDVSPLSTIGALCVAAAPASIDNRRLFNQLLMWCALMAPAAAAICFLLLS